jgi:hypothetical protein
MVRHHETHHHGGRNNSDVQMELREYEREAREAHARAEALLAEGRKKTKKNTWEAYLDRRAKRDRPLAGPVTPDMNDDDFDIDDDESSKVRGEKSSARAYAYPSSSGEPTVEPPSPSATPAATPAVASAVDPAPIPEHKAAETCIQPPVAAVTDIPAPEPAPLAPSAPLAVDPEALLAFMLSAEGDRPAPVSFASDPSSFGLAALLGADPAAASASATPAQVWMNTGDPFVAVVAGSGWSSSLRVIMEGLVVGTEPGDASCGHRRAAPGCAETRPAVLVIRTAPPDSPPVSAVVGVTVPAAPSTLGRTPFLDPSALTVATSPSAPASRPVCIAGSCAAPLILPFSALCEADIHSLLRLGHAASAEDSTNTPLYMIDAVLRHSQKGNGFGSLSDLLVMIDDVNPIDTSLLELVTLEADVNLGRSACPLAGLGKPGHVFVCDLTGDRMIEGADHAAISSVAIRRFTSTCAARVPSVLIFEGPSPPHPSLTPLILNHIAVGGSVLISVDSAAAVPAEILDKATAFVLHRCGSMEAARKLEAAGLSAEGLKALPSLSDRTALVASQDSRRPSRVVVRKTLTAASVEGLVCVKPRCPMSRAPDYESTDGRSQGADDLVLVRHSSSAASGVTPASSEAMRDGNRAASHPVVTIFSSPKPELKKAPSGGGGGGGGGGEVQGQRREPSRLPNQDQEQAHSRTPSQTQVSQLSAPVPVSKSASVTAPASVMSPRTSAGSVFESPPASHTEAPESQGTSKSDQETPDTAVEAIAQALRAQVQARQQGQGQQGQQVQQVQKVPPVAAPAAQPPPLAAPSAPSAPLASFRSNQPHFAAGRSGPAHPHQPHEQHHHPRSQVAPPGPGIPVHLVSAVVSAMQDSVRKGHASSDGFVLNSQLGITLKDMGIEHAAEIREAMVKAGLLIERASRKGAKEVALNMAAFQQRLPSDGGGHRHREEHI